MTLAPHSLHQNNIGLFFDGIEILLLVIGAVLFLVLRKKKVPEEPVTLPPEGSEEVPSEEGSEPTEGEGIPTEETPSSDPILEGENVGSL